MNSNLSANAAKTGIQANCLPSYSSAKILKIFSIIFATVVIGGCSSLPNSTTNTLEKQIELQRIQYELATEPDISDKKTAEEFEKLGDRYFRKGDINRAYLYYVKGLGTEPDNVSLLHKQGLLLIKKNKYGEAEQIYEKLRTLAGQDSCILAGLGAAYFGQGKFDEAEHAFLAAVEIKKAEWLAHEYLGLIYSQRQEFDKAVTMFKTALGYRPNNVSIVNNLAVTCYLNGNFNEAVRLLRVLAATTNDRRIHNNLALAYFQFGSYENALESFKKGSETEAAAYNNMGQEYLFIRKNHEAIEAFEKAIALHPKFYPSAQKNLELAKHQLSTDIAKSMK